ncbi:MAG: sigma-70 family RNA polymerase sigma factor [Myxococcales bacterium]|nr:sigma-70 family RNA polymerase sigma factor [Myxococcales bacterium]
MKTVRTSPVRVQNFYEKYGPAIYSRCRRMLRDAAAAEDATQEVFLRVLRHIDTAPVDEAALAWIYRISTNYCLNALRDGRRQAEPLAALPDSAVDDFEDSVMSRELTGRVMGDAPPELKAPAVLYHVKGMEQARIAKALGVSRRTVIYRLNEFATRARRFIERAEAGAA